MDSSLLLIVVVGLLSFTAPAYSVVTISNCPTSSLTYSAGSSPSTTVTINPAVTATSNLGSTFVFQSAIVMSGTSQSTFTNGGTFTVAGSPYSVTYTYCDQLTPAVSCNTCTFTFTVTSAAATPTVTCNPTTVPTSSSTTVLYNTAANPVTLANFNNPNNVNLQYRNTNAAASQNNQLLTTVSSTQQNHQVPNFPAGQNTVTVTATDGTQTATCSFTYYRTDIQCPPSSTSASATYSFNRPTTTFPNTVASIVYTGTGITTSSQPTSNAVHTLSNLPVAATTVTATATDASNNVDTCIFTYTRTNNPVVTCPTSTSTATIGTPITFTSPTNANFGGAVTYSYVQQSNNGNLGAFAAGPATTTLQTTNFVAGNNPITVTATSGAQSATCVININAVSPAVPTVTCPTSVSTATIGTPITFNSPTNLNFGGAVTYSYVQQSNNGNLGAFAAGPATTTLQTTNFVAGNNPITVTATSGAQSATCVININAVSPAVPTVTCPTSVSTATIGTPITFNSPTNLNFGGAVTYSYVQQSNNGNLGAFAAGPATTTLQTTNFVAGNNPITVTATSGAQSATCVININAVSPAVPTVTCPTSVSTATIGTPITFNSPTNLNFGGAVTYSYVQQSNNGNLGAFAAGPATTTLQTTNFVAGNNPITVTATSGAQSATCVININAVSPAVPTVTCPTSVSTATIGTPITFNSPTNLNFGGAVTYSYVQQSNNGNLGAFAAGPATTTLQTTNFVAGNNPITVTATSGAQIATCIININAVSPAVPTATCPTSTPTATIGTPITFNSPTNANFGGAVTYSYLQQSNNGNLGAFAAGPATTTLQTTNFVAGNNPITVTATSGSQIATCIININAVSPAAITCPTVTATATIGTPITFNSPTSTNFAGTVTYSYTQQSNNQNLGSFTAGPATTTLPTTTFAVGANVITATATSGSQTATCPFTINAVAAPVPAITCPTVTATATIGTPVTFNSPTSTNFAGTVTYSYTQQSNNQNLGSFTAGPATTTLPTTTFAVGANVITATATSGSQTATCPFTINAVATPAVTCPTSTPTATIGTPITITSPTSTNFAGTVTYSYTQQSNNQNLGSFTAGPATTSLPTTNFAVGANVITVRATSGSQTATCILTINAVAPLTINCPGNQNPQTFSCGGPTTAFTFPVATSSGGTGAVTAPSYSSSPTGASFATPVNNQVTGTFPVSTSSVTYTITAIVTDQASAFQQCIFTVTFNPVDTTPPTISCSPSPGTVTGTINCGVATTNLQFAKVTASDICGAVQPVTYTSSSASTTSFTDLNTGNILAPFALGTTTVTARVVDSANLVNTCTFQVIVTQAADTVSPTITCPQPTVSSTVTCGVSSSQVQFTQATATDNCGIRAAGITYTSGSISLVNVSPNVIGTFPLGTNTVTATVTDTSNNPATCPIQVTVSQGADTINPTITCPQPTVSASVNCGVTSSPVQFTQATATDNCGIRAAGITYTSGSITLINLSPNVLGTFPVGTNTVTASVTDTSNNPATCPIQVTVSQVDNANPVIMCPANAAATVNCGTPTTSVQFPAATATDDCAVMGITYSSGSLNFIPIATNVLAQNVPVGVTTVTATASDTSVPAKTHACQFTMTVTQVDAAIPTIMCTANIAQNVPCTTPTYVANFPATATDDCGVVTVTYASTGATVFSSQSASTATFSAGTSTVTATATDQSGKTRTCITTVTVTPVDSTNPVITCPASISNTVCTGATSTSVTWTAATATDNCPAAPTITYSSAGATTLAAQASNTATFNQGTSVVTATARDASNNVHTCMFNSVVTVQNPCLNHGCQNGGQCMAFPGSCNQYFCTCPPCYYGRFCEVRVDQCSNHKCQNGAACVAQANSCTDYTCTCPPCFEGSFCQTAHNPCSATNNQCQNGGVCANIADSCASYSCQCQGCFTGYRCQTAIPNPCTTNPCRNGGACARVAGTCYSYQCTCAAGFTGYNCETAIPVNVNPCNNFPCQNAGSCTCLASNQYVCTCPPGYGGINCQTSISTTPAVASCTANPCINGATCFNGYHQNSSPNNVYQNQYTCVCANGFSGTNCASSTTTTPSLNMCTNAALCRNGGQCRNAYFSFSSIMSTFCVCPIGFAGQYCEKPFTNPCNSNPCQNGAACSPFNTYFTCSCVGAFAGTTCEQPTGDTVAPVPTCPAPQIANVAASGQSTAVSYPPATATDNSGGMITFTYSNPSGSTFNFGTTTVLVTATDPSGNSAQCMFTVTVRVSADTTNPVLTCPATQPATVAAAGQTAVVTFVATAIDNSGGAVNLVYSPPSGSAFNIGTTEVTVTGTDPSGNSGQCRFNVIVTTPAVDTTPPTFTNCPTSPVMATGTAGSTAAVTFAVPTATDSGSGLRSTVCTPASPITLPVGFASFSECVATDNAGNEARCVFSVATSTVGGPVISNCPSNIEETYTTNEFLKQVSWTPEPTSTVAYNLRIPGGGPGSYFQRGCTAVYYGFEQGGASNVCSFTVCLRPAALPTATCPTSVNTATIGTPITFNSPTNANFGGAVTYSYVQQSNNGNLGSFPAGSATTTLPTTNFVVGNNPITVTATSGSQSATCTININAVSPTVPTVTCPTSINTATIGTPITFPSPTNANFGGAVTYSYVQQSNNGNLGAFAAGSATTSLQTTNFVVGNNPITVTATSGSQSATCIININAVSPTVPTVTCPTSTPTATIGTPITFTSPTNANFGGAVTYSYLQQSNNANLGSFAAGSATTTLQTTNFVVGNNPITVTATSGSQSATCIINFNAVSPTAPTITCPTSTPTATIGTPVTFNSPTNANFVGTVTYSYTLANGQSLGAFTAGSATTTLPTTNFVVGANVITARATSGAQTATCTITINAVSSGALQVTCPPNIVVTAPAGQAVATVNYAAASASAGTAPHNIAYSQATGTTFPITTTTVTATATDAASGSTTCMFTITVNAPLTIATCPPNQVVTATSATGATVTYPPATTSGGTAPVNIAYSRASGTNFNVGSNFVVTVQATDANGATATCTFTVTVNPSSNALMIQCPANQAAQVVAGAAGATYNVYYPPATATGGSGSYAFTYNRPSGTGFPLGGTLVTAGVTDGTGANQQCTFTITVTAVTTADTTPPVLVCPANVVTTATIGNPATMATVSYSPAVIYNNGNTGAAYITGYSHASGSNFNLGVTTVTVSGIDPSGNTGTCTFSVTVNSAGAVLPVITGCDTSTSPTMVNVIGVLAAGQNTVQLTWNAPTATVNGVAAPVMATSIPGTNLNTGSQFSQGLTEIIYTFGSVGAQSTCKWYVFVRAAGLNPCSSSPCGASAAPNTCFFSGESILCRNSGRKRRDDTEDDNCSKTCKSNGGICATQDYFGDTIPLTCFMPGDEIPVYEHPCAYRPCENNGTCVSAYDDDMDLTYQCLCPTGWRGRHCEHRTHFSHDDDENRLQYPVHEEKRGMMFWMVGMTLGILGCVVIMLGAIICRLVAVRVSGVRRAPDEKVLVN